MLFTFPEFRKQSAIRRPQQILLVAALVLAAYYPVASGELCYIDDVKMVSTYSNATSWTLKGVFTPGWTHGVYYRPVMILSYVFDNYVFHLDAGFLHIENIALHIINALLTFWLTWQILPYEKKSTSIVPLVAALIFGLHPINTESVSWISGRTDILACVFVLLSANFLFLYKRRHSRWFLLVSGIFMLLGGLTKETALAFIPGAILIMMAKDGQACPPPRSSSYSSSAKSRVAVLFLLGIITFASIFFLRSRAILTNDTDKIGFTITAALLDIPDAAMVVMNAFVFYVKKLFIPFPLNFVIVEIDPLYEFMGLPLVMLSLYALHKKSVISGLFIAGLLLIMPAFVLAFNQIAWAPYAERYVYISSAFITIASVLFLAKIGAGTPRLRPWVGILTSILLVISTVAVFQRSMVWKSNLALFQDVVEKNPTEFTPRACYGFALADHGQFEKARDQFLKANKENRARFVVKRAPDDNAEYPDLIKASFYQNRFGYWEDADLGLAYISEKEGKTLEAIIGYERICDKIGNRPTDARKRLVNLYTVMLARAKSKDEISFIKKKLVRYTDKWRDPDGAEYLFSVGRTLFRLGDRNGARFFLKKAYGLFRDTDQYKNITSTIINKLEYKQI